MPTIICTVSVFMLFFIQKSRSMWWFSKCSCVIVGTLIYFILSILTTAFSCFYFGWRIFYGDTCFYITDNSWSFLDANAKPTRRNGHYLYYGLFGHSCVVSVTTAIIHSDKTILSFLSISTIVFVSSYFYDTFYSRTSPCQCRKSLLFNRRIRSWSWICLNRKFNYFLPF